MNVNGKGKGKFNKQASASKHYEERESFYCKKKGHLKVNCKAWKARMAELQFQQKGGARSHKAKAAIEEDIDDNTEIAFVSRENSTSTVLGALYVDSGDTSHMTNDRSFFVSFDESKKDKITVANGQQESSAGIEDGFLYCKVSETVNKVPVKNILFVLNLESNLLSVKQLTKQDNTVAFEKDNCIITRADDTIAKGEIRNNLYRLECERANIANHEQHKSCIHLWHHRLEHRDPEAIRKLTQKKQADGITIDNCSVI